MLCIQETKWTEGKTYELGNGFKLFYYGTHGKRNWVETVLNPELKCNVWKSYGNQTE